MSDLDDFKATYFDECSELLLELEEQFAAIEEGDRSSDRLNAVFRAIHSIKGGGGAFGFTALVAFAHAYETLLAIPRRRIELSDTFAAPHQANDIAPTSSRGAGRHRPGADTAPREGSVDALTRCGTATRAASRWIVRPRLTGDGRIGDDADEPCHRGSVRYICRRAAGGRRTLAWKSGTPLANSMPANAPLLLFREWHHGRKQNAPC